MEAFFMQVFNGKFNLKVYLGTTGISYKKKKILVSLQPVTLPKISCSERFCWAKGYFLYHFSKEARASQQILLNRALTRDADWHYSPENVYKQLSQHVLIIKAHILLSPNPRWNLYGPPSQHFCIKWEVSIPRPNEPCQWPQAEHGPSWVWTTWNFDRNFAF